MLLLNLLRINCYISKCLSRSGRPLLPSMRSWANGSHQYLAQCNAPNAAEMLKCGAAAISQLTGYLHKLKI